MSLDFRISEKILEKTINKYRHPGTIFVDIYDFDSVNRICICFF